MMRLAGTAVLTIALLGCGSAAGRLAPGALGVSARDADTEARSTARVWSSSARLRWIEGQGIDPGGMAIPGEGFWRFHYTATDQRQELVVEVRALQTTTEERPPTSPPGIIIGDNALSTSWIDSQEAMGAAFTDTTSAPDGPFSMLLVPTRPEQWIIRAGDVTDRWHVHARSGEVLQP